MKPRVLTKPWQRRSQAGAPWEDAYLPFGPPEGAARLVGAGLPQSMRRRPQPALPPTEPQPVRACRWWEL